MTGNWRSDCDRSRFRARSPLCNQRGGTLIELVVLLGVLGVVSALGITKAQAAFSEGQLKRQSSELLQELESVAAATSDLQQPIFGLFQDSTFTFSTAEGTILRTISLNRSLSVTLNFGVVPEATRTPLPLPARALRGGMGVSTTVGFYPSGAATAGTISISDTSHRSCVITQSARGRRTLRCR